ncbi:MAG: (d)CMP kinase [Lachnospiraceae bacterium]|nr:(d)CMP kinase [Lachnospiraceae bacterium]
MSYKIAIDGPSSAGKSTLAKTLAKELGYVYIDTGAMYRAIGYYLIENNIDFHDEKAIEKVLDKIDVMLSYDKDNNLLVFLNGKDISKYIRTEKVGEAASVSSQFMKVREKLVALQRKLAESESCVMDGRDIASNVLPNANLKLYVTASDECRAKRRYLDEKAKGIDTTIEKVLKDLKERDHRDMTRANNPLVKVEDAIEIDTSNMTEDEVVDYVLKRFF